MTVRLSPEPAGARSTLHATLLQRSRGRHSLQCLLGSPRSAAPLANYLLAPSAALKPNPLRGAKRVGWVFPIVGGSVPALGELSEVRRTLTYAGIIEGNLPQQVLDAAAIADARFGGSSRHYEVRLLRAPELRLLTLWLYAPRRKSLFLEFLPQPGEFQTFEVFQNKVASAAAALKSRFRN